MQSVDERIAYLRERNARNCNRRSPTEGTSSLLVVDPRDTEGWKLRRSALLRGYFPLVAPPPATVVAHAEDAPGETDKSRAMSSALIAIAQSTSAKEAPPPLHELSNPRRRPRSDESSAIITIDPALLREQTRRAQEQHGVASSVPQQQPHWKMSKVLTGHRGWVRAVAVDPANEWFCTGANDTIIKVWDMSSGASKVNLIGHKEAVRGLAVSALSPYLYSCGDDHAVKCWDLERNECIRDFHGHGGAVFSVAAHPGLDIIISGSRDKTVRVWDVRSRASVHTLTGHSAPVLTVAAQSPEPQIISGGDDCMIYLWDLAAGKALTRLTRHRKPVRQVVPHFGEQTLLSCGADNIRKWKLPEGDFLTNLNLTTAPRPADTSSASIWTCCAVSKRNTVFVGSDDGQLMFFDWESHSLFQATKTKALAGALESERGICCGAFDVSGTRLVTGESDKTVKIWKRKDEVAS